MSKVLGYASQSAKEPLVPFHFERREPRAKDVVIDILYCGICHTDIHIARNEWKSTTYPCVPGHEIVGRVLKTGTDIKNFKAGDIVAVGCMVESCRSCPSCKENLEQYCDKGAVYTYNGQDKIDKTPTFGGYSTQIVVDEAFVLQIPKEFKEEDLPGLAPLLCAGITTYSPLRHWKVGPKSKVGVVGLGGLGHMALKLAHAMGAEVTLFTHSPSKIEDGKRMGAHHVIVSSVPQEMKKAPHDFDLIIDTIALPHSLDSYTELLHRDGTLCLIGLPALPHPSPNIGNLIRFRRTIAGSLIGGIKETQEMLDFCAKHHILSDIELISMEEVNEAYERALKSDVKYRFVIDLKSLKQ